MGDMLSRKNLWKSRFFAIAAGGMAITVAIAAKAGLVSEGGKDIHRVPHVHLSYPAGTPFSVAQVDGLAIDTVNHTGYGITQDSCAGNGVATFNTQTKQAGPSITDPSLERICSIAVDNTDKAKSIVWVGTKKSIVPIDVTNNKNAVGTPIPIPTSGVGQDPYVMAIAIDSTNNMGYALVPSPSQDDLIPFDLKTHLTGQPVTVSSDSGDDDVAAIAIDESAKIAYVTVEGAGQLVPVDISGKILNVKPAINVGGHVLGAAIDRAHGYIYVINTGKTVIPVTLNSSHTVGKAIPLGTEGDGIAVDEAIHTAYVVSEEANKVVILNTNDLYNPAPPVDFGFAPNAIAVDPSSNTAYVGDIMSGTVTPITPVATPVQITFPTPAQTVSTNDDIAVKGTGEPYATVRLFLQDKGTHRRSFAPVTVGSDGTWSVSVGKLPAMKINANATQTYAHLAASTAKSPFIVK